MQLFVCLLLVILLLPNSTYFLLTHNMAPYTEPFLFVVYTWSCCCCCCVGPGAAAAAPGQNILASARALDPELAAAAAAA